MESKEKLQFLNSHPPHSKAFSSSLGLFLRQKKHRTTNEKQEDCQERNNNVDPQRFIDFYDSKDWMIGKNKMKDWKACVRTWESKEPHIPNWFNGDSKEKPLTKEEQKELDEILKNISE